MKKLNIETVAFLEITCAIYESSHCISVIFMILKYRLQIILFLKGAIRRLIFSTHYKKNMLGERLDFQMNFNTFRDLFLTSIQGISWVFS